MTQGRGMFSGSSSIFIMVWLPLAVLLLCSSFSSSPSRVSAEVHDCFPSVEEGDNTTDLGEIKIKEFVTDGALVDIVWMQDPFLQNTESVKESIFIRTGRNTVYRSKDLGKTWENVMGSLTGSTTMVDGNVGVARIYHTNTDLVFLGFGTNMWTWNSAHGFNKVNTGGKKFARIRMHPYEPGWMLAAAGSPRCYSTSAPGNCYGILYVTKDHGKTWTSILDYVADYSWGNAKAHTETEDTVYAITWDDKSGNQNSKDYWDMKLRKTGDFFKSNNVLVLEHCVGFIFTDHRTLWAIQPVGRHDTTLRLFTSNDGGRTVSEAQFPISPDALEQGRYTILDTREGMTFVNVEHGQFAWGHLYTSDATDRKFSLSLEHNARLPYGAVDFQRLDGIDGVYVANYRQEEGRGPASTVITTDKGGEWYHLTPASDSCKATSGCHLHLFGYTSGHAPFYALESAVGLMIGLGNEGQHLNPDPIDTYVSRDGGLTWSLAREGSHIYEYGDFGGIIVMARNLDLTNEIVFSWNEGDTWHPCHFTNTPLRVFNIMSGTGPSYGSSQQFVAYGKRGDTNVLLHFDFSELHEKKCVGSAFPGAEGSDYELWAAGRVGSQGKCVLGRHLAYVRRKPSAQCVNGVDWKRGMIKTRCECTRDDFTCDYCYEVAEGTIDNPVERCVQSESCMNEGYDPTKAPSNCNGTYSVTKGYRLVVGDECLLQPTNPYLPSQRECPFVEPTDGGSGVSTVWLLAAIAAITALVSVLGLVIFFVVKVVKNRAGSFQTLTPASQSLEDETAGSL